MTDTPLSGVTTRPEFLPPEYQDLVALAVRREVEAAGIPFRVATPEPYDATAQRVVLAALWRGRVPDDTLHTLRLEQFYTREHQWLYNMLYGLSDLRKERDIPDAVALMMSAATAEFGWVGKIEEELYTLSAEPPVTRGALVAAVLSIQADWEKREWLKMLVDMDRAVRFGGLSIRDAVEAIGEWEAK